MDLFFSDGPFHPPCNLHESSCCVSPVRPVLDSKHPSSSPPSMQLVSGLGDWTLSMTAGPKTLHPSLFQQVLLARRGESFHVSCFPLGKGALLW
jgi:hypothetical protein